MKLIEFRFRSHLQGNLGDSLDTSVHVEIPCVGGDLLRARKNLHALADALLEETLKIYNIDLDEKVADLANVNVAQLDVVIEPAPIHTGVVSDRAQLDTTIQPDGMQTNYLVLSDEERAKGFVRPVRRSYKHVGIAGPKYRLRDLDESENNLRDEFAKFEVYPCGNPIAGKQEWCIRSAGHAGNCCPRHYHAPHDLGEDHCCATHGDERLGVKTGRYWRQADLDKIGKGCGTVTTMGNALAETYARQPDFYGSTFCAGCHTHIAVGADGEFVWDGTNERVGT